VKAPRIPLNLASEPFRRDRPLLVGSAIAAVLLVALLALQVTAILREREAASEARATLAGLNRDIATVNRRIAQLEAELRKPANAAVLERSAFLNVLLQRKGISWTRLFSDLEAVFPHNVRLVTVRPSVTAEGSVQLEMVVGAQAPEPVIDLLKRLEGSALFSRTELLSSAPPTQNEPLYRYRLSVNYAQKL
jgi:type IV pilus assembly protein PilN